MGTQAACQGWMCWSNSGCNQLALLQSRHAAHACKHMPAWWALEYGHLLAQGGAH